MPDGPDTAVILELYEEGMTAGPSGRARLLCTAAGDDPDHAPLGDVDRAIWTLHNRLFAGSACDAIATCPHCGALAEFTLPADMTLPERSGNSPVTVPFEGRTYALRLPRLADMSNGAPDLVAIGPDAPWDAPGFATLAEDALDRADPGMRPQLGLVCETCEQPATLTFDVSGWVWAKIALAAPRLIDEVARLARAFGWSEADILALSPARRAHYLKAAAP